MKNQVFGSKRYIPSILNPIAPYNPDSIMRAFSFWDNEAIDDVTERFMDQNPNVLANNLAQVVGRKLTVTTNTYAGMTAGDAPQLYANTPFCIQGWIRLSANPTAYGVSLITCWSETDSSQYGWTVYVDVNGTLYFGITADSVTFSMLNTAAGKILLGNDYHIAVERDENNLVTIYINGLPVKSGTIAIGSLKTTTRMSVRRGMTGQVWDIKVANKALLKGPFVPPGKLANTDYAGKYSTADAAHIVCQLPFRRDDPNDEVTGNPVAMTGQARVKLGQLVSAAQADKWSINTTYWGAGDFTYELRLNRGAVNNDVCVLPSHWNTGGVASVDNRFLFSVNEAGALILTLGRTSALGDFLTLTSATGLIRRGLDYHVVVERYNGVLTAYVDGVAVITANFAQPLLGSAQGIPTNKFSNATTGNTQYGVCRLWDFRVATKALYKGIVKAPIVLPKMPVDYKSRIPKMQLRVGSMTAVNGLGLLTGFAKDCLYGDTLSFGEIFPQVFWHAAQNRTVKIKGIFTQNTSYLLVFYAPSNEPRTADMPVMTNRLQLGGTSGPIFDLTTGTAPAANNVNDYARYYATAGAVQLFSVDETFVPFSFV